MAKNKTINPYESKIDTTRVYGFKTRFGDKGAEAYIKDKKLKDAYVGYSTSYNKKKGGYFVEYSEKKQK